MKAKQKIHYAWIILIAASAINFGGLGTLFNASGIFFPSVIEELGIGLGDISLYMTILSLSLVATAPIVGKVLLKFDVRITLTTAFIICLFAMGVMSQFTSVWQWYVSGAIIGAAGSFIFYIPVPIIIGNWFHKRSGIALGIVGAFTGFGGAIMNPLISYLIESFGWRNAYVLTAIIVGLIVLPFTIFLIRYKPEEMGLKPYGYEEKYESEKEKKDDRVSKLLVRIAFTSTAFVLIMIIAGLSGLTSGFNQLLASFGDSIGLSATLAASLVSVSMTSNVITKCLFGACCDRFGVKQTFIVSVALMAIGFSLFFLSGNTYITLIIAAALYGIHAPVIVVGLPLLTKELFGLENYSTIFPYVSMSQTFLKGLSFAIFGFIYDITSSYVPVFMLGIVVCFLMIVFSILSFKASKRLSTQKALVQGRRELVMVSAG